MKNVKGTKKMKKKDVNFLRKDVLRKVLFWELRNNCGGFRDYDKIKKGNCNGESCVIVWPF